VNKISQESIDLIVAEEVSSEATYRARYEHPEWPGGHSGITIGIGYDVGYATPKDFRADWTTLIPQQMIETLSEVVGLTGEKAHSRLTHVRPLVTVPWEVAKTVFLNHDVPKWIGIVEKALPNCDKLSPDCLGALVSLAYNRGPSFATAGTRYAEMRAIKAHMTMKQFNLIPGDFRSMKRLWPNKSERGLPIRREHEARLFERGLTAIKQGEV
jgi:hypothetical protein